MNISCFVIIWIVLFRYVTLKLANVNPNKCGTKLLDDLNLVPDSAFSASSSFEHNNIGDKKMDLSPKAARESYDKDNQEFAWCPNNKVSNDLQEYLEIDMGRLTVINFAQTRGRFAQGSGKEYIPFYKIRYKREMGEKWRHYKKYDMAKGFTEILKGSIDPFLDAYETLDPPIVTRWIRIYPYSFTKMRVCMKLQLFGCTSENHVLEYRIPQGSEPEKTFISLPGMMPAVMKMFQDSSYDGLDDRGLLNSGLGRLVDNKTGTNFMYSPTEAQHFVGWNKNYISPSAHSQTLTLWFRFDSVRNFSSVRLSVYENVTMKITQPSMLDAKFSILGDVFTDSDTILSSIPESKSNTYSEFACPFVQFNLHHRIGQYLQLRLHFQSDWILLTEIDFISDKVNGYPTAKEVPISTDFNTGKEIVTEVSSGLDNPRSHGTSHVAVDVVYILTIVLCILVAMIVVIVVVWLLMRQRRINRKKTIKKNELAFYSQAPFITRNSQSRLPQMNNSYIGQYASGSLRLATRPPADSHQGSCPFPPNMSSQNNINVSKPPVLCHDSSIYTSIPGSDNDSSLSTDYMASSGVNSNHPYAQTIPTPCSIAEYIINQPQIIGNPLAEFYDTQQVFCRAPNTGICTYDPELFSLSNPPLHINSINNAQSFAGTNCYTPIEYGTGTLELPFNPISYDDPLVKKHIFR